MNIQLEETQLSSFRNEYHGSESRSLRLKFSENVHGPVYTGHDIQGENGTLKVALIDGVTGEIVKSGGEAAAILELVVLDPKNLSFNDDEDWSCEDFNSSILVGRDGRGSLLKAKGDDSNPYVYMKDGVGCVNGICFKHRSNWFKKVKCRLGVKIVDQSIGVRIREAMTEPFWVRDRRAIKKEHKSLVPKDHVWRLKRIGKNGPLHRILCEEKISTVKNFLTRLHLDRESLQQILQMHISGGKWKETINHALTCKTGEKRLLYLSPSSDQKHAVVFNNVGKLMGLFREARYLSLENLSELDKDHGCQLVESAFQHWNDVKKFRNHDDLLRYLSTSAIANNTSEVLRVDCSTGLDSPPRAMNVVQGTGFSSSSQVHVSESHYMENATTSTHYSFTTIGSNIDHIGSPCSWSLFSTIDCQPSPGNLSEYEMALADHDRGQTFLVTQNSAHENVAPPVVIARKWAKISPVLKWLFKKKKIFSSEDAAMVENHEPLLA